MVTKTSGRGFRAIGLSRSLAAMVAAGALVASAPVSRSMAQTLLEQCWTPDGLLSRADEKPPRRGAPGHARSIPKVKLQSFAPVAPEQRGSIRRVALPAGKKLVALTFDLCEQPGEIAGYDGAIVDYLRANNVRATFFAGGKWLLTHEERSQQMMADRRFELASHGWAHRNVRGLSGSALASELIGPQAAYEAVRARLAQRQCVAGGVLPGAPRIRLFRFPYGACSPEALTAAAENGLLAVQWDVSTGDPSPGQSAKAIAAAVLRHARPGSIVLMHANGRGHHTSEALPLVIPALRAKGYQFVTVSELLAAGRPEIASSCYDAKPGDTDKYDRLFAFRTEVHRAR
ncbi:MAG: polysaccharide deacetylase family protein [Hyphomicrobiaceae bacterium]